MKDNIVLIEEEEGIMTITLNRPEKMNALNRPLISQLRRALEKGERDERVKALIIAGNGRAFCAGGDLEEHPAFSHPNPMARMELIKEAQAIPLMMIGIGKPIIAAINGIACGAGLELAMACDIRIASKEARFAALFAKVGTMSDMGSSYLLPKLVGAGKALEMLLTGDFLNAHEALRIGLINRVVAKDRIRHEARSLATQLVKGPTLALRFIKAAIYKGLELNLKDALDNERFGQTFLLGTEDVQEARKAFTEKRSSIFRGK